MRERPGSFQSFFGPVAELEKNHFLGMVKFSEKINNKDFVPKLFDPKLTQPKYFQTGRTRPLAHLPSLFLCPMGHVQE